MEKLVKCKACGQEIAKSAKICPSCGKKQKRRMGWKILGAVILVIGILGVIGNGVSGANKSGSSQASTPSWSLSDYKKQAVSMAYRKAMLKQYSEGQALKFSGTITDKDGDTRLLVSTGEMSNYVLIDFAEAPKVVNGDVIEVYGNYKGVDSYTTVIGGSNEVPLIAGAYLEILQESN